MVLSEKRKLAGIIFDMDGVLIDSEPLHYESTIKYLNGELGLSFNEEENREFLGRTDEYMFRVLKDRYDLPQAVSELIERRRDIYLELLVGNVKLVAGIAESVRRLKSRGYKLAVASSKSWLLRGKSGNISMLYSQASTWAIANPTRRYFWSPPRKCTLHLNLAQSSRTPQSVSRRPKPRGCLLSPTPRPTLKSRISVRRMQ